MASSIMCSQFSTNNWRNLDDKQDWQREVFAMDRVFRNSFLTVAATSITSSHQSFLGSRNLWPLVQVPFVSKEVDPGKTGHFYVSPGLTPETAKFQHTEKFVSDVGSREWNKRGWTFQEKELAWRILYIGKTQLHFRCQEGRWDEELGLSFPPIQRLPISAHEATEEANADGSLQSGEGIADGTDCTEGEKGNTDDHRADQDLGETTKDTEAGDQAGGDGGKETTVDESTVEELHQAWYEWSSDYSSRRFTNETDRLPALAGLAKYSERINPNSSGGQSGRYLCGLWRDDLVRGLMWRVKKTECWEDALSEAPYLSPSWSWISHRGKVKWSHKSKYVQACDIVDINIGYTTDDPTGTVTSGSITLKGKLLQIPPPQIPGRTFHGGGDFHMERIILHHHTGGAPYYLDLSHGGRGFGNCLFDKYIVLDNHYYETQPIYLGIRQHNMAVLLLGWEAYPPSETREIRRKVALFELKEEEGGGHQDGDTTASGGEDTEDADVDEEDPVESREEWLAKHADPEMLHVRFKNAFRLPPHDPDHGVWDRIREAGREDEEVGEVENWPVGLLLAPEGTDTDGLPLYRRIGVFERILQVNNDEARAVFNEAETEVVKIL